MRAVGVDGWTGGWVAVSLTDGRLDRVWSGPTLDVLLADEEPSTVVGVDLPLGGVPSDWRSADLTARRILGRQRAKVFLVPPRPVWTLPYADANARCRELTGNGVSIQAYRLLPKMLEAETYRETRELYEIHPELVFQALHGSLLGYGKKTWNGLMLRRSLLDRVGVRLPGELTEAGNVPADDVLDAAAVAWCASGIARGETRHTPEVADQFDPRGRPIVIHY